MTRGKKKKKKSEGRGKRKKVEKNYSVDAMKHIWRTGKKRNH
jgi:hypothetical protein